MKIYDFTVKDNKGADVSLSQYKGKVLLIINSATKCGLTPQYEGLEKLYEKYGSRGFEILDFPSNQFLGQAPGSDEEIQSFCTLNYGTKFPRFSKIDVNGENTAALFKYLKEALPEDKVNAEAEEFLGKIKDLTPFKAPGEIKWNFGKFLIDKDGSPVDRYSPGYSPESLEKDIEALLN